MSDLRIYSSDDVGPDGYPWAWHHDHWQDDVRYGPIKDQIRTLADHRCERCGHPYRGRKYDERISQAGQWSPCDKQCRHTTPYRMREIYRPDAEGWRVAEGGAPAPGDFMFEFGPDQRLMQRWEVEAQWRILTVHHLNGVKWDCRWWNLAALCQRCHLTIQGKVYMDREWATEHTDWFKPHAAGWYAVKYLEVDLDREETMARLDELLDLEKVQDVLTGWQGA